MRAMRLALSVACVGALLVLPAAAAANHKTRPHTSNMHALGHSADFGDFELPDGQRDVNSDLAFWGELVFQGDYDGFRVMTRGPGNPRLVSRTRCNGDQGDIVVWEDILVRSWNTKRADPRNCDGSTVPANWEGVHVFDISDIEDPRLVAAVEMPCGSHTATAVPDHANDRLIVYSNNSSSSGCTGGAAAGDFMDVIAVPFDNPAGASIINRVPLAGPVQAGVATGSHDAGVILGDENKVAVASADITNVFDIGANETPGGSLTNPVLLFTIEEPGVGIPSGEHHAGRWHSAAFTWDGEVIILGWEPGGGAEAECEASDPAVTKSAFFYDADTGAKLGQWTLPRPQGADENCTIHNYNTVPLRNGRYVLVGGHYQAGTWVVDFTNLANPVTLGWSDPPSAGPGTSCDNELPDQCTLTGAWSSYWYNGFIYEGHISEGLNVFRFSGNETAGALRLPHLNPQTQEFTIG